MGRFSRDAPWIRRIFTPSGVPATRQPFAVSEDVQLTQQYLANGQTQGSNLWLNVVTNFGNPGQDNILNIIDPQNANANPTGLVPTEPEVWRVFFVSLQIVLSPVGDFIFDTLINLPNTGDVTLGTQMGLDNGQAQPTPIYPGSRYGSMGTNPLSTDADWTTTSPLLLPVDPSLDEVPRFAIRQISGQAAGTETLVVASYILRNPQGLAHIL